MTARGSAETPSAGEVLRACRSCNWGACSGCVATFPAGARRPRLDIGSSCRVEANGKTVRAVVVDARGEPEARSSCGESARVAVVGRIARMCRLSVVASFLPGGARGLWVQNLPTSSALVDRVFEDCRGGCMGIWGRQRKWRPRRR